LRESDFSQDRARISPTSPGLVIPAKDLETWFSREENNKRNWFYSSNKEDLIC
jgi:hypothetical protein